MPESKLAEKLGFEIRDGLMYINGELRSYALGYGTQALWNLCLELSERQEIDRDGLARLISKAIDQYPIAQMGFTAYIADRVIEWLAEKEKKA